MNKIEDIVNLEDIERNFKAITVEKSKPNESSSNEVIPIVIDVNDIEQVKDLYNKLREHNIILTNNHEH